MSSGMKPSIWGFSSAGRALAWHARGHRFDPGNLHQKEKHCTGMCGAFLLCLPSYAAAKFMLDICGKLWYNSFCNCGYSTSASISAFQAEEVGSIPIARSMQKRRWFVKNQRLSLSSGPTFGPTSDFERQKALAKSKKKRAGRLPFSSFPARIFFSPRCARQDTLSIQRLHLQGPSRSHRH